MAHGALRLLRTPEYPLNETREVAKVRLQRVCLACSTAFDSAWAGERVCPRCKATTAWRSGSSVAGSNFGQAGARSGRKGSS